MRSFLDREGHHNGVGWTFVWVVTSADYIHLAAVSTASFQIHLPEGEFCWLVTEEVKYAAEYVPDWVRSRLRIEVSEASAATGVEASRMLKVRVPRLLGCDCVFVDADILCVRSLEASLFSTKGIAAARNRETTGAWREDPNNAFSRQLFDSAGWDWPDPYYNTGFIVYRATEAVMKFSDSWENSRKEFREKTGKHFDQPAFNRTAAIRGGVTCLSNRYNAPVSTLPQLAKGASCLHYYVSGADQALFESTTLGYLARHLIVHRELPEFWMREILSEGFPFVGIGAQYAQYRLSGQWGNYFEKFARVRWNHFRRALKL